MSIDALRSDKAVLSEVAAATTMDHCWGLVRAVEDTGKTYMLSENVCYFRQAMMILNMVQKGLFGKSFTYSECGYVHDCRCINFKRDGSLTWRGEMTRDHLGNAYPTHAIGPVAQWIGINKTDRLVSLVSMASKPFGARYDAIKRFGPNSPQAKIDFKCDTCSTLIKTANGVVINLRYDISSPQPFRSTVYATLQGETASFRSITEEIWIESRTRGSMWEPISKYARQYDHPMWQDPQKRGGRTDIAGADFLTVREFFDALRAGKKSPIDVYDAAAWSCIIPLSAQSIRENNKRLPIPDFKKNAKA
jgi:predicted dehydrogenase